MNRYHRTERKVWLTGKAGSESLGSDGLMSARLRTRPGGFPLPDPGWLRNRRITRGVSVL